MEWQALTNLRAFVRGESTFGSEELKELTFLLCANQMETGKLAIWIDADEDVNPLRIEIFDDEFGVLSANGIEAEMLEFFSQESDQVSQEFAQFSDEDGVAQYEVSFPTEDANIPSWVNKISHQIYPVLESYKPKNKFEDNLKQFCLRGLSH